VRFMSNLPSRSRVVATEGLEEGVMGVATDSEAAEMVALAAEMVALAAEVAIGAAIETVMVVQGVDVTVAVLGEAAEVVMGA
jgi:hypothetical protein